VQKLAQHMQAGDTIIDGGNSYFKDDVRRAGEFKGKGIHYVDVGTSGGVWGLDRGYCMMIGGPNEAVQRLDPIFKTLAPGVGDIPRTPGREKLGGTAEEGYIHCGPSGSGHFVKMVHNGIEYGLMQAYAEGFDIFKNATSKDLPEDIRYDLNLPDIAEVWRRGSVVSSWLLDLTAMALTENPTLSEYEGYVQDSGEGRWTIQAALEEAVPADVLTAALYVRFRSRQQHTFAEKMLSAMRQKFGGHVEAGEGQASSPASQKERVSQHLFQRRILRTIMAQLAEQPARTTPRIGKQGDPCIMVIFGAAGDLTARLLIPALYNLARADLLSKEFAVLGVARAQMSDEDFARGSWTTLRVLRRLRRRRHLG
jgi:6-phosphogluconate dehydrogenase